MAALSPEERAAIRDALASQLKKEPFERALGRALRRKGLDYDRYIDITSELRERARKNSTSLEEAARSAVEEQ